MLLADPNANAIAYLVLRHLYDGDVIEWPIPEDHPHAAVLQALEQQGLVARWDRVWPLHDRYRLTENGIRAIESVYRPAGSEQLFEGLRRQNLTAEQRRAYLQAQGLDAVLWPILHDPTSHWTTYGTFPARYQQYIWEDRLPQRPRRAQQRQQQKVVKQVVHHHHRPLPRHNLVDLDDRTETYVPVAGTHDYDVS